MRLTDHGRIWTWFTIRFLPLQDSRPLNERPPMAIQWFPGHMHLTKKAITERMKDTDVVIELLDARLPGSSANPLLAELTAGRPSLKVLNKQDVADPERTALWLAHYNSLPDTRAIGLDASVATPARALIDACHLLAPKRGGMVKPMRVLICGVPNVGKSTLINTLTGRKAAKTGDEAGITKAEQRITLADDFYLYDTPGMLWPRIAVDQSGYHLAASGAIGRNAYDDEAVALELLAVLKRHYPGPAGGALQAQGCGRHDRRGPAGRGRAPTWCAAGARACEPAKGRRDRDARVPQRHAGPHHAGDARGVRVVGGRSAKSGS